MVLCRMCVCVCVCVATSELFQLVFMSSCCCRLNIHFQEIDMLTGFFCMALVEREEDHGWQFVLAACCRMTLVSASMHLIVFVFIVTNLIVFKKQTS